MKKIFAFLLLSVIILGTGCKKDKQEDPVVNTDPDPTLDTLEEFNGILIYLNVYIIHKDTTLNTTDTQVAAMFSDKTNTDILVNSVLLDGTDIPYDPSLGSGYFYDSFPGIHNTSSLHWVVNGNNGVPNVDYIHTRGLPTFNWRTFAPDEIDIKKDLNLILTGLKNTDYTEIALSDYSGHSISKDFDGMSNPSISFSPSELATLQITPGKPWNLQCTIANITFQTIGGKTFSFENEEFYFKDVTPH